jgi:hypothetical protein
MTAKWRSMNRVDKRKFVYDINHMSFVKEVARFGAPVLLTWLG